MLSPEQDGTVLAPVPAHKTVFTTDRVNRRHTQGCSTYSCSPCTQSSFVGRQFTDRNRVVFGLQMKIGWDCWWKQSKILKQKSLHFSTIYLQDKAAPLIRRIPDLQVFTKANLQRAVLSSVRRISAVQFRFYGFTYERYPCSIKLLKSEQAGLTRAQPGSTHCSNGLPRDRTEIRSIWFETRTWVYGQWHGMCLQSALTGYCSVWR